MIAPWLLFLEPCSTSGTDSITSRINNEGEQGEGVGKKERKRSTVRKNERREGDRKKQGGRGGDRGKDRLSGRGR